MKASSFDHLYAGPSLNSQLGRFLPEELRQPPLAEIDCNGFLTGEYLVELGEVLEGELSVAPAAVRQLLDLGCGSGGLAKHLARRVGCRVMGIDASAQAIARARTAHADTGIDFRVADFTATTLAAGSIWAAVSLDSLYLAAEHHAALMEIRRVLSPGGSILFTIYWSRTPSDRPPEAWCAAAASAGLEVESCRDLTAAWRSLMLRKHEARWCARDQIARLLGKRADAELAVSAAMIGLVGPSFLDQTERYELRFRHPAKIPGSRLRSTRPGPP